MSVNFTQSGITALLAAINKTFSKAFTLGTITVSNPAVLADDTSNSTVTLTPAAGPSPIYSGSKTLKYDRFSLAAVMEGKNKLRPVGLTTTVYSYLDTINTRSAIKLEQRDVVDGPVKPYGDYVDVKIAATSYLYIPGETFRFNGYEKPTLTGRAAVGAPSLPYSFHHDCIRYEGELYVIGGYGGSSGFTTFYKFDGTSWTTLAALPRGRFGHTSVLLGDELYLIGGTTGTSTPVGIVDKYNFKTGVWSTVASCPSVFLYGDGCSINGKIYIFGGYPASGVTGDAPASFLQYVYDPVADTWTVFNSTGISPRLGPGVCTYNGFIYLLGGRYANAGIRDLWKINPTTGEAVRLADPPAAVNCRRAFLNQNGTLVSIFGESASNTVYSNCCAFDPEAGTWSTWLTDGTNSRAFGGVGYLGDTVYYFCGIRNGTGLSTSIKL